MNFDAIIIGGGLGGLTAGAVLSRFGKKVLVLEQHYIPGGCATTFKRKDFVMEVGLHEMDGLHQYDIKRQIFDFLNIWDHIDFIKIPELYRIKSSGFDRVVPHGTHHFLQQLGDTYPEDKKAIQQLLVLMEGTLKEIPKLPTGLKAKLMYPLFPLLFPNIVKVSKYTVGQWLDNHIKNEALKMIIQGNLVYYSDDPYELSLLYFAVAQASYIGGGGHFIKGGSQNLSNFLANEIESQGGQVLLGKKVTDILVEDNQVQGVRYVDSFNHVLAAHEVFAPVTIANAAIPLIKNMLPESYATKLGKQIDNLEEACSLISLYIGFNRHLNELGVKNYSTFLYGDTVKTLKDIGEANRSNNWENKPFVFVDYGQIDAELCPDAKSFGVICAADHLSNWEDLESDKYKSEKERVAQVLLKRLEQAFPGITQHIEHYELATAKTIQSYTLNPKGTPYGFAQTPKQAGAHRLPNKSPLKNLYYASAWSNPGGGFTGAIISGYLAGVQVNNQISKTASHVKRIGDKRIVELIERVEVAQDTFELVFEKPMGFDYKAGQYAVVAINHPAFTKLDIPHRPLSIVSHPDEPNLRFAMRASKSGFKQSCLAMSPGEKVTIYGPMGDLSIKKTRRPIVFLVGGIGITPVVPLIRELQKNNFSEAIHLFYSNRNIEKAAYHKEFTDLKLVNFKYHPIFTSVSGRLNSETLKGLGDEHQYDYYIIGTSFFLKAMKAMLQKKNIELSRVFMDDFG